MHDPQIISALIQSIGGIVATLIASLVASIIGKNFADRERLKQLLATASHDIAFLLEVEKAHTELHVQNGYPSMLLTARRTVKQHGYSWSGQFIPSRAKRFTLVKT